MTSNKVFKALADPTRRRVLELLRRGALTAGELADRFPLSKSTMSAHFSVLQEAGLVEAEKNGRVILYRLEMSVLEDALLGFADALGIEPTKDAGHRREQESARCTAGRLDVHARAAVARSVGGHLAHVLGRGRSRCGPGSGGRLGRGLGRLAGPLSTSTSSGVSASSLATWVFVRSLGR